MTAPLPDGSQAARAMVMALADADIPADAIDYVKAHGSGTRLNDPTEVVAIRKALGHRAEQVLVNATKGLHGHALGASGAIETAIVALSLSHGCLPATANLEHLDPACDLQFIQGEPRAFRPRYALCNSFGFGGINAAIVLRTAEDRSA
jgi:3-oxoacyl-[acyl-carrier-protein] synthase II